MCVTPVLRACAGVFVHTANKGVLTMFQGDVTLKIEAPKYENKHGWKLEGQTISVTIGIRSTVSELKKMITCVLLLASLARAVHSIVGGMASCGGVVVVACVVVWRHVHSACSRQLSDQLEIPANKQKLKPADLPVLRDQATLASYNFENGRTLALAVKERGGRKR